MRSINGVIISCLGLGDNNSFVVKTIIECKNGSAVQAHMKMLQSIIDKMDAFSKECKQWCLTLQIVVLGFVFRHPSYTMLAVVVVATVLFAAMDAGYLAYSRWYRRQQENFVKKIDVMDDYEKEMFHVRTLEGHKLYCEISSAFFSFSVLPFYVCGIVFAMFLMVK